MGRTGGCRPLSLSQLGLHLWGAGPVSYQPGPYTATGYPQGESCICGWLERCACCTLLQGYCSAWGSSLSAQACPAAYASVPTSASAPSAAGAYQQPYGYAAPPPGGVPPPGYPPQGYPQPPAQQQFATNTV